MSCDNKTLVLITCAILLSSLSSCSTKKAEVSQQPNQTIQATTNDNLAEVEKAEKNADFDKVKDSFTICSVNGVPLMAGEYKRQLKTQQQQVQASLAVNPETKVELLRLAKEKHISLTPEEKAKILSSSRSPRVAGQKNFQKFLKDNKVTQAQFEQQVLEMGLACKMAKTLIEQNLVRELINRELLSAAAKTSGFSKQAFNKYTDVKKDPQFAQLVQRSGLTPEQAQAELIKNELCTLMIEKIQNDSPVSDADIRKFYDDNKARLRHGPRLRLSQILIGAPMQDRGPILSLKAQLRKSNPNVSDVDLDKQVKAIVEKQKQKAESLLVRAKSGANFAELANQNTEDMPAREAKNGGDLGFQEEDKLVESFAKQISKLQDGQVTDQLIQSPLGFHIFKVTGREPAGTLSYDECKDQIKGLLTQQKSREAVEKWLADQRQKATITLSPEFQALLATKDKNLKTP